MEQDHLQAGAKTHNTPRGLSVLSEQLVISMLSSITPRAFSLILPPCWRVVAGCLAGGFSYTPSGPARRCCRGTGGTGTSRAGCVPSAAEDRPCPSLRLLCHQWCRQTYGDPDLWSLRG